MIMFLLASLIWGLGSAFVYWKSGGSWEAVTAIATWFLVLGVVFAFHQVQQARKSTNAQLAFSLFSKLRDTDFKKILSDTIYALKPEEIKGLTTKQKVAIDELIDWFDMLGVLVAEGIVDEKIAIESFAGPPALRCWYQLAPYIRQESRKRGFYADNYEDFTRRSLEHFDKNKVRIMFYRKDEEKDRINLVAKLQSYKTTKTKSKLYPRSLKDIEKRKKTKTSEKLCRRFLQKCGRNSGKKLREKFRRCKGDEVPSRKNSPPRINPPDMI